MTDWRLIRAGAAILALALGPGPASAQPSADSPDAPGAAEPAPEAAPGEPASPGVALPRSPEEEAAERQARLDELFIQLAKADDASWEELQQQIWLVWARSGSPSMDLLLVRAARAIEAGENELALRFLNDLVRLAPDFAEAWNKRATVYFLLEEYGRSVADIQRTLALEPRHFGALSGLGIILERLGDKSGAMRAYRRGLEIHPHMPGAAEAVERLKDEVDGRDL